MLSHLMHVKLKNNGFLLYFVEDYIMWVVMLYGYQQRIDFMYDTASKS